MFPPREARLIAAERQAVTRRDKGHGRTERRTLTSTTALNGYLDWPGLKQVFKVERRRTVRGQTTREVSYGITSLPRERADAAKLLTLVRDHWGIENRLFHVRDVTFGEDACRVRSGSAPHILSGLRNLCIYLLDAAGFTNKARALRRHAAHPDEALALLTDSS